MGLQSNPILLLLLLWKLLLLSHYCHTIEWSRPRVKWSWPRASTLSFAFFAAIEVIIAMNAAVRIFPKTPFRLKGSDVADWKDQTPFTMTTTVFTYHKSGRNQRVPLIGLSPARSHPSQTVPCSFSLSPSVPGQLEDDLIGTPDGMKLWSEPDW